MRRMDKVFYEKSIAYEDDPYWNNTPYECCQAVVEITKDYIITVFYSSVLDPMFNLYDRRTFEFVGQQNVNPEYTFFGEKSRNPGGVAV